MRTKLDKQWDNLFNLETEFKENFIKLAAVSFKFYIF